MVGAGRNGATNKCTPSFSRLMSLYTSQVFCHLILSLYVTAQLRKRRGSNRRPAHTHCVRGRAQNLSFVLWYRTALGCGAPCSYCFLIPDSLPVRLASLEPRRCGQAGCFSRFHMLVYYIHELVRSRIFQAREAPTFHCD